MAGASQQVPVVRTDAGIAVPVAPGNPETSWPEDGGEVRKNSGRHGSDAGKGPAGITLPSPFFIF
jgi:hypothetical protein